MIGLVIASQGRLALEFVTAAEHAFGQSLPQLEALVIDWDETNERARQRLIDAIARVDTGDGVVVLADICGGTVANLAISMVGHLNIEVLGGINVATLVKLVRARDQPLRTAVAAARDSGRRHLKSSLEVIGK